MKRPALQNKQVTVLRMAFRAPKVVGTFEKQAPGVFHKTILLHGLTGYKNDYKQLAATCLKGEIYHLISSTTL